MRILHFKNKYSNQGIGEIGESEAVLTNCPIDYTCKDLGDRKTLKRKKEEK